MAKKKVMLLLPEELHIPIKTKAASTGLNMSTYIESLIRKDLTQSVNIHIEIPPGTAPRFISGNKTGRFNNDGVQADK